MINSPVKPVKFDHVLHTPSIFKQLLSVSKLCHDNKAFTQSFFLVKDIHTKKTLLQGHLEDGLYKLFPSASSKSFTSPSSSSTPSVNSPFPAPVQVYHTQLQDVNLWHNRLGHPSFPIVSKVMKLCILKTSNKSSPEFLCSSSNGQGQSFAVC